MAPGPSSCHGVSHQPFLSRPFLSVGLTVPSSTAGHPPSQRHVQAKRKRQEQDWKQTSLFRLCHHQNSLISSHFSGRFCRLPGHLCPCFLLGKWNIHLVNILTKRRLKKWTRSKASNFDYATIKLRSFQVVLTADFVASLINDHLCPWFLLGKWNIHFIKHNNLQTQKRWTRSKASLPILTFLSPPWAFMPLFSSW